MLPLSVSTQESQDARSSATGSGSVTFGNFAPSYNKPALTGIAEQLASMSPVTLAILAAAGVFTIMFIFKAFKR